MFGVLMPIILGPFMLMFGVYPTLLWPYIGNNEAPPFKYYRGLKLSILPFQIYPWHVILSLGILFGLGALIYYFTIPMVIILGLAVVGGIIALLLRSSKNETVNLISNVIASKKGKFCPPVEFQ